jgi:hypothetical protein
MNIADQSDDIIMDLNPEGPNCNQPSNSSVEQPSCSSQGTDKAISLSTKHQQANSGSLVRQDTAKFCVSISCQREVLKDFRLSDPQTVQQQPAVNQISSNNSTRGQADDETETAMPTEAVSQSLAVHSRVKAPESSQR